MSVLDELSSAQGTKSDIPNLKLAQRLADQNDTESILELVEHLWNEDKKIQGDCIKVLYEVGYRNPQLISSHARQFLRLLSSANNRMVWGAMIALSTIAPRKAPLLFKELDLIHRTMQNGSVITVDNGIKTLAGVASAGKEYHKVIFPFLLSHLETCRPMELAQHAQSTLPAVRPENRKRFLDLLSRRYSSLTISQQTRVKKVVRSFEKGQGAGRKNRG
jgi:hypothetical protein